MIIHKALCTSISLRYAVASYTALLCSTVFFGTKCWDKYPHLNPHEKTSILANIEDEDSAVCLVAKCKISDVPRNSSDWFIDSGCSDHM